MRRETTSIMSTGGVESEARAADDDNSGDGRSSRVESQPLIGRRLRDRRMGKSRQNDSWLSYLLSLISYRLDIADSTIRFWSRDCEWSVS